MLKALIQLFIKQTGRNPNAVELLKLKFKAANQSGKGKVIEFPKDRITPFYKPRPGEGVANTKQRIFQIDDELEKISAGEGKYAKMSRDERENLIIKLQDESSTLQGFTPTVVPNKRAEFLKKYTKDGQPNDVELNALSNEHRILSAEAKKLGDAGENYEKFSQLNKRTEEIEEILDFMNKEFPEGMASGGMARVKFNTGGEGENNIKLASSYSEDWDKWGYQDFKKYEADGGTKSWKDWYNDIYIPMLDKQFGTDFASGGIAGQLHMNQGGRAGFANGSPAVDPRMLQSYEQNKAENEAARLLNQASRSSGGYTDIYNKYFKGKARQGSFGFQEGRTSDTLGTYHSILNKDRDQIIKDMAYQMQQEGQNTAAATALKEKQAISQQQKDEAEGKRIEAAITGAYGLDTMEGKKYALEAEMLGMPTAAYMDYVFTGNPEGIAELGGTGNEYINPYNVYYSKELKRQQAGGIPAAQQIQYGQVMAPPWSHTQQSTAIGLPPGVPGLMGPGGSAPSPTPSPMYIPYADALSSYKQQYQTMNQPFTIGGYGAPNQPTYAEFQRQWGSKGGRIGFTGGTGGNTYQDFLADKTVRPHPDDKSWRDVFYRWLDKQRANQAKGGRIGYAEGTKKLGEGQYSPTKDKAWMQTMPKIDPNLRKLMEEYKKRKGLAEILGV